MNQKAHIIALFCCLTTIISAKNVDTLAQALTTLSKSAITEADKKNFFTAIKECNLSTIKALLAAKPAIINAPYNPKTLFSKSVPSERIRANSYLTISISVTPLDFLIAYITLALKLKNDSVDEAQYLKSQLSCLYDILEVFLQSPVLILNGTINTTYSDLNKLFMNIFFTYNDPRWDNDTLKAFRIMLFTKPDLIDVMKQVGHVYISVLFTHFDAQSTINVINALKLLFQHPTFKATNGLLWSSISLNITYNNAFEYMPVFYQTFQHQPWFQNLDYYPVFKVIGDLIPRDAISPTTARAFLKIDQKNPPQTFTDTNLEYIQKAYSYAKTNSRKKLGAYLRRAMTTLANTPQDIGGIITAFEPLDNPLVSPPAKPKPQPQQQPKPVITPQPQPVKPKPSPQKKPVTPVKKPRK